MYYTKVPTQHNEKSYKAIKSILDNWNPKAMNYITIIKKQNLNWNLFKFSVKNRNKRTAALSIVLSMARCSFHASAELAKRQTLQGSSPYDIFFLLLSSESKQAIHFSSVYWDAFDGRLRDYCSIYAKRIVSVIRFLFWRFKKDLITRLWV